MPNIEQLMDAYVALGHAYRANNFELGLIEVAVKESYSILDAGATCIEYADLKRGFAIKKYSVFRSAEGTISRPFRSTLMLETFNEWKTEWDQMLGSIDQANKVIRYEEIDKVVSSAATVFFCVIDLFKRNSRKTAGTFFEWLLGCLLVAVTGRPLSRQIAILAQVEAEEHAASAGGHVPTDIVLGGADGYYSFVFPVKTSTRERIGQIFTHQRFLDVEYRGKYRSSLLCVSEVQIGKSKKGNVVKETCVPKQISFNEKYVAHIDALYYLDPPMAYIADAMSVPVRTIGQLFQTDLGRMIDEPFENEVHSCEFLITEIRCTLPANHGGPHTHRPGNAEPLFSAMLALEDVADYMHLGLD